MTLEDVAVRLEKVPSEIKHRQDGGDKVLSCPAWGGHCLRTCDLSPTPCLPGTHAGISQDVLKSHSMGSTHKHPYLTQVLYPPCFSPRATFVLPRAWILAGRCWAR